MYNSFFNNLVKDPTCLYRQEGRGGGKENKKGEKKKRETKLEKTLLYIYINIYKYAANNKRSQYTTQSRTGYNKRTGCNYSLFFIFL